jgi:hypothetical protein
MRFDANRQSLVSRAFGVAASLPLPSLPTIGLLLLTIGSLLLPPTRAISG